VLDDAAQSVRNNLKTYCFIVFQMYFFARFQFYECVHHAENPCRKLSCQE
jgi:hypothetical protein